QRLRVVHVRRQAVEVPLRHPFLVDDEAGAALLGLLLARLRQGGEVARQERTARVDLAGHQRIAGEDDAAFLWEQRAVVHRALGGEDQPEQADLLAADDTALRSRPMRIMVA